MREMNEYFELDLAWFDPHEPRQMASALKRMESEAATHRSKLPSRESLAQLGIDRAATAYWNAVRACL
jgi:hypothetical protein